MAMRVRLNLLGDRVALRLRCTFLQIFFSSSSFFFNRFTLSRFSRCNFFSFFFFFVGCITIDQFYILYLVLYFSMRKLNQFIIITII